MDNAHANKLMSEVYDKKFLGIYTDTKTCPEAAAELLHADGLADMMKPNDPSMYPLQKTLTNKLTVTTSLIFIFITSQKTMINSLIFITSYQTYLVSIFRWNNVCL
jgi:hypothetical protein